MTDPIRSDYDGPMLHIIRHFKPHTVYMFLSSEIEGLDDYDDRYSKTIDMLCNNIGIKIHIHKIRSGVIDVSDFDIYNDKFGKYLKQIHDKHPDDEILINISSGTAQMEAALCLYKVSTNLPLIPIQVSTPEYKANAGRDRRFDYDIKKSFENNMNNEIDTINRCSVPDILGFRLTMIKEQIKSLVRNYEYDAALSIYNEWTEKDNDRLEKLLMHMKNRMDLDGSEIKRAIKNFPELSLYPVKDIGCSRLCEYLLVLETLSDKGLYTAFLLRLEPMIINLQEDYLRISYGFDINKLLKGDKYTISRYDIMEYDKDVLKSIDEYYNIRLKKTFKGQMKGPRILNAFIYHFTKDNNSSVDFLNKMNDLKGRRNNAAHSLVGISRDDIVKDCGIEPEQIICNIKKIIIEIYQNKCKQEIFDIYNMINTTIEEEMEKGL